MSFSAAYLGAVLEAHTPLAATGLVVAVSGGLDSACLATALAQLRDAALTRPLLRTTSLSLRAIHVDHGLQAAAAAFRAGCARLCEQLAIPLSVVSVAVEASRGVSVEAAARDARYQGFSRLLRPGECLLTAHHAMDQAETLLLQLLRGAGLKGMSAMPLCRAFATGWHMRPLLDIAHHELLAFGEATGVSVTADPMNDDARFDRVYLRTQVWPVLVDRWPAAEAALARSARHVADAQSLLDQSASAAVQKLRDGNALSLTGLRALSVTQQLHALRYWIGAQSVTAPSAARLDEALRQFAIAAEDHLPAIVWGDNALRRYRQRVFLTAAAPPRIAQPLLWPMTSAAALVLGKSVGVLRWAPQFGGLDAARLPGVLRVQRRVGGESLRPHARARTHSVQHLCQSLGVLPWMRDALPMVYAGESLVAVGDLWQNAGWCVDEHVLGLGIVWQDAPILV